MNKLPVFVSHSSKDMAICQQFVEKLREAGIDVWYDKDGIQYGDLLCATIGKEIYARPIFILLLSRNALSSEVVFDEFNVAKTYMWNDGSRGRKIIPVTLETLSITQLEGKWSFLLPIFRVENNYSPLAFTEMVKQTIKAIPSESEAPPPPNISEDDALPILDQLPLEVFESDESYLPVVDEGYHQLTVFLLLDSSRSMEGDPIKSVNNGIWMLYNELVSHLDTVSLTKISVITFAHDVRFSPLTPLRFFMPPIVSTQRLSSAEGTALGAALLKLKELLSTMDKAAHEKKAMIFILTDGEPTDSALWHQTLMELNYNYAHLIQTIVLLGCGLNVDTNWLKSIRDIAHNINIQTLFMKDITSEKIKDFFGWVAVTLQNISSAILEDKAIELSSTLLLPPGIESFTEQGD